MNDWNVQMEQYVQAVEEFLNTQFTQQLPQKKLHEAMRYSLLCGGKRIRPVLVLEFCRLCGGDWHKAIPFAGALEMIHTYSLIHDDLPCMDDDDFRRGRPTSHKVYGEATAVLAGDALLTAAFETACNVDTDPQIIVKIIKEMGTCAGNLGMVGGQILDIDGETMELSASIVHKIQELKTGALIVAACVMGSIAGGATEAQIQSARVYGDGLGRAFQTQDDILDVVGSFEKMGKTLGTDHNKNTFVRIYGVERCQEMVQQETKRAIDALAQFEDASFLTHLAQTLANRNH